MTEPHRVTLSLEEGRSLLVCPECGGQAYSHTDLSRAAVTGQGGEAACSLNVMESRVAAVERIIEKRLDAVVKAVLDPYRELFVKWEKKLPDHESSDPAVVTLAECLIDLGNLLVESKVLAAAPVVLDMEDIDGDLAEIEDLVAARAMAGYRTGVGRHAPGCDGWRPPTELGFGKTSPAKCIPGCPVAGERRGKTSGE